MDEFDEQPDQDQPEESKELEVIEIEPVDESKALDIIPEAHLPAEPIMERVVEEVEAPQEPLKEKDRVNWTTGQGKRGSGLIIGVNNEAAMIAVDAPAGEEHPVIYREVARLRRG